MTQLPWAGPGFGADCAAADFDAADFGAEAPGVVAFGAAVLGAAAEFCGDPGGPAADAASPLWPRSSRCSSVVLTALMRSEYLPWVS